MSRKHCWVYYDTFLEEVALVMKPHRRALHPRYSCLIYQVDRYQIIAPNVHGEVPNEDIIVDNIRDAYTVDSSTFRKSFVYLGPLNTGKTCQAPPNTYRLWVDGKKIT